MKPREALSWVNNLFNPSEVRRTRRLQKQWDELDDVAAIVENKNNAHKWQGREEEERDELLAEINMLLERVDSDIERIKTIVNHLTAS